MNINKTLIAVVAGLIVCDAAAALALPFGTLSFVERVATVRPSDTIDVRVRFTLDPTSPPLAFDSARLPSVYNPADLPKQGRYLDSQTGQFVYEDFASYTLAYAGLLTNSVACDQTFVGNSFCSNQDPAPYTSPLGEPRAFIQSVPSFSLQPGESFEDTWIRFIPINGEVPPGTYRFHETSLYLYFNGISTQGQGIQSDPVFLGTTCASHQDDCAFTRIVNLTPVPAPSSGLLMLGGLVLLAGYGWRQRRPVGLLG